MINNLQQRLNEVEKDKQQTREKWVAWIVDHGFPPIIQLDDFQIILQFIENTQAQERHLCNEEDREAQYFSYLQKTRTTLINLLHLCGETIPNNELDISSFGA